MNKNKITNPLTILGLFAGLTEVGGSIILPLLSEETQSLYVWFLMLFPSGLVILFFLTLWTNNKCLYGPSDYSSEVIAKLFLTKDAQSSKEKEESISENNTLTEGSGLKRSNDKVKNASFSDLKDKALNKICEKLNGDTDKQVALTLGSKRYTLDALSERNDLDIGIEVKQYFGTGNAYQAHIPTTLTKFEEVSSIYKTLKGKTFEGIIIIVIRDSSERSMLKLKEYVNSQLPRYSTKASVIYLNESEL